MRVAEPPAGCNVTVIEKDGEVLFVDAGFACMWQETVAALSTLAGISVAASARPSSPTRTWTTAAFWTCTTMCT